MKALTKIIIISVLLNMVIGFQAITAQTSNNGQSNYRVTAYQKGKNQVVSVSNEIEIVPPVAYYLPNAFTPNGDGLNDSFGPKGQGFSEYNLQIFNRWGNLIFETNDFNTQWDGTYHNELAPLGSYVYKITGKGPTMNGKYDKLINLYGSVTLLQ